MSLVLVPATPTVRLLASVVNYFPFFALNLRIFFYDGDLTGWDMALFTFVFIFTIVQLTLYCVQGQTVGKIIFKLNIYSYDGQKAKLGKLLLRLIVGPLLSFIPPYMFINYGAILMKNKQCLHDKLTHTFVGVWREEAELAAAIPVDPATVRRRWALVLDIVFPGFIALALWILFYFLQFVYIVLFAISMGLLAFLYEPYLKIILDNMFNFGIVLTVVFYLITAYLIIRRRTSIGRILLKVR
ncbi:RDD family protein [Cohnella abietis]|uniref:RDD domain-containing protein n=1 Tax=Cohnella abietis TaxID=2507935 RepID=A0A3T1CYW6_9BACL|nr:RDD family protein [Cohnella abietis]BBI31024.1 hypothetical protein KCTCHS21_04230 [Cohnella abietis]